MTVYTDDQRDLAISRYLAVGCNEAARETSIPSSTIHRWAVRAGANKERPEHVQAAIDARMAQGTENLSYIFLAATEAVLEAIERDGAEAKVREVVGAWTRAVHDYHLRTGQATGRVDEGDLYQRALDALDQVASQRAKKEAA